MRSSGKIVIKPRATRKAQPSPSPEPEPEPSEQASDREDTEQDGEDGVEEDGAEEQQQDSQKEDMDVDEEEGGGGENDEGDGDDVAEVEAPAQRGRGRGRPRGRPRGSGSGYVSTGRPRGRPRGTGRPRGRPRGSRNNVSFRARRDSEEGEVEGEDSQVNTPGPDDVEALEAIAGGKPFRRIQGKIYIIENDDFVTESDAKGDEKIDEHGNLLGGRIFKAQTFTLPSRHPERKFMLAIEAARTSGFRDSLYYFRRNLLALKLNATQAEKDYLIDLGKLGAHLRTRSVTLITARSAYKLHGAKMVVGGKIAIDDYYEEKAIADAAVHGLKAGDLATQLLELQLHQQNEATALLHASKAAALTSSKTTERSGLGLYRTGGPTTVFGGLGWGPFSEGPLNVAKKAMLNREGATEENWMMIMAERTSEANQEWSKGRKEAMKVLGGIHDQDKGKDKAQQQQQNGGGGPDASAMTGDASQANEAGDSSSKRKKSKLAKQGEMPVGVYEPHSGIIHYRSDTQPTQHRWESVPDDKKRRVLGGTKAGKGAWALAWVDTIMEMRGQSFEDEQAAGRRKLLESMPPDELP